MSLKRSVRTIIRRMIVTLQTEQLHTMEQIRGLLDGNGEVDFKPLDRDHARAEVRLGVPRRRARRTPRRTSARRSPGRHRRLATHSVACPANSALHCLRRAQARVAGLMTVQSCLLQPGSI